MPARTFRRRLSSQFVQTLKANAFWLRVCSDRQLQPEIRNNCLTVYFCGQALLRELRLRNDRLHASIHHKFVPLQKSQPSVYLPVAWKEGTGFRFTEELQPELPGEGDSAVLKAYKRLMKFEAGPEDLLQQQIVAKAQNLILDQQVEFPGEGHNKIDVCCFDPSIGRIVFVEIKRIDDPRLLGPGDEPEVIGQLRSYAGWIRRQRESITSAYREVVRLKRELGLGNRLKGVPEGNLCVEAKPLLVVGNCTATDVRNIHQARAKSRGDVPWSRLWRHLEQVACGIILCGTSGCQLAIRGGGGQRWRFGD